MARSKKNIDEKFFAPFPSRLRKLMEESGDKQEDIAAIVNKSRQTVSQYCNGLSEPGYSTLAQIAKHYGVSTDFLLGISDVRSQDTTVHGIVEYTGLSEEAVCTLAFRKSIGDNKTIQTVNVLIEQISAEIYAEGYHIPQKGKKIDGYYLGYDNGYTWKYKTYNRVLKYIGEFLSISRSFDVQHAIKLSQDGKILSGFTVSDEDKLFSNYIDNPDNNLCLYQFSNLYSHELIEKVYMDKITDSLNELKTALEGIDGND